MTRLAACRPVAAQGPPRGGPFLCGCRGSGNDSLIGGTGNDSLIGGLGVDTMVGGTCSDIYVVDVAGDVTTQTSTLASEIDTVRSGVTRTLGTHIERLTLIGNAAANVPNGGSGNDTLSGGAGRDTLIGGAGLDSLLFNTAPNATTNVDAISGFSAVDDRFLMENAVYIGLGASTGVLSAGAFRAGTAAGDASDRILYHAATGRRGLVRQRRHPQMPRIPLPQRSSRADPWFLTSSLP